MLHGQDEQRELRRPDGGMLGVDDDEIDGGLAEELRNRGVGERQPRPDQKRSVAQPRAEDPEPLEQGGHAGRFNQPRGIEKCGYPNPRARSG